MYFLITIDTEAQILRAKDNHLDKLLYGNFGNDENIGIIRMMEIANKYNSILNFFIDFSIDHVFGLDKFKKLVDTIKKYGHEIHVHIHVDQFRFNSNEDWFKLNNINNKKCSLEDETLSDIYLDKLFTYIDDLIKECDINKNNIGYRTGGWRYSKKIIHYLKKYGYKYSFNYNFTIAAFRQIDNSLDKKPFVYPNGIVEIPITIYKNNKLDCIKYRENNIKIFKEIIDTYRNTDEILTMILHSWSLFATKNDDGHFVPENNHDLEAFSNMFQILKRNNLRSNGISEITSFITNKLYADNEIYKLAYDKFYKLDIDAVKVIDDKSNNCCYCNKNTNLVNSCNVKTPRKCTICGSIERGRAFKNLFDKELHKILSSKKILCVSPSNSDYNLLKKNNNVRSMAIVPGFDLQMDMCNMSTIDNSTIDAFIAIKVFEHCENDVGAFNEIHRILKPNGLLIFTGSIRIKGETSISDNIHSWYSKEMYDKYKIGSFRHYGVISLYNILKDKFNIKLFNIRDNLTDSWHVFFVCMKQ